MSPGMSHHDDRDTLIDLVLDLDIDDDPEWSIGMTAIPRGTLPRGETFAGFEVPLVEMWRHAPAP